MTTYCIMPFIWQSRIGKLWCSWTRKRLQTGRKDINVLILDFSNDCAVLWICWKSFNWILNGVIFCHKSCCIRCRSSVHFPQTVQGYLTSSMLLITNTCIPPLILLQMQGVWSLCHSRQIVLHIKLMWFGNLNTYKMFCPFHLLIFHHNFVE